MKHTSPKSSIIYPIAIPVLSALFVLIYKPFEVFRFLDMSDGLFLSNVLVIAGIVTVVTGGLRLALHLGFRKKIDNTLRYLYWCIFEIIISGIAVAAYIYLIYNDINDTLYSISAYLAIVFIPYLLTYMAIELYQGNSGKSESRPGNLPSLRQGLMIEFNGDTANSNISLPAEDILYIHSVENYVHIYHYNGTEIAHTQIRATMNGVESMVSVCKQIRRAHRSYIINVMLLDKVIKDKKGNYFAVMKDNTELPVSKKYLDYFIEEVPPWKLPDIDLNKILTHRNE